MSEHLTRHPHLSTAARATAWIDRIVLGGDRWGTLRIGHARHLTLYRLGVYPPGITDDQRRAIRIWHGASLWAPLLWLAIMIAVTAAGVHPLLSALGAAVVAASAAFVAAEQAQPVRGDMRWLVACAGEYHTESSHQLQRDRIIRIAALLRAADKAVATGEISPVTHEAVWTRCFQDIGLHDGDEKR